MKKVLLLCILILIVSGCAGRSTDNDVLNKQVITEKESTAEPIDTIERYNKAVSEGNWDKAKTWLDGQAKKTFEANLKQYKNTTSLLQQENQFETKGEEFCIVKSKVDLEIKSNTGSKLIRKWMRYFLVKRTVWKIVKAEEMQFQYPQNISIPQNPDNDKEAVDTVKTFVKYSVQGDIEKASMYLSGNLLNRAEKYKINDIPGTKLDSIDVKVLGESEDEKFVFAEYTAGEKKLNALFHLIRIKDHWLINELIG